MAKKLILIAIAFLFAVLSIGFVGATITSYSGLSPANDSWTNDNTTDFR